MPTGVGLVKRPLARQSQVTGSQVTGSPVTGSTVAGSQVTLIRAGLPASLHVVLVLMGVVLSSYVTLVAGIHGVGSAADSGVDLCAIGEAACEAPSDAAAATDEPAVYATPAEVDCQALGISAAAGASAVGVSRSNLELVDGACSPPVLDFHYRVSRVAESERPNGALRPQRARRAGRTESAYTGLPIEHGSPISLLSLQPIAMYALPGLCPPAHQLVTFQSILAAPSRSLEPLDRPPRAAA
jgi:hypothetical protein